MKNEKIHFSNFDEANLKSAPSKGAVGGIQVAALLLTAITLLIPRLDGLPYFPGKYLWAEDGSVFINQAQTFGLASLWMPYNGYLHVYPRLIAILANNFALINRPVITSTGWFLAYIFMFFVLIRRAYNFGLGFLPILLLVILVSLQPHNGENFFNITNSQWMLGAGLSFLVLTSANDTSRLSPAKLIVLILLGLTGPFSIILIPALFLKAIAYKDIRQNFWEYCVILFCAGIQALVLINSGRVATTEIGALPWNWIISFIRIALFGADSRVAVAAAVSFWCLLAFVIFCNRAPNAERQKASISSGLMFFAAALFVIASQYSVKHNPMGIVVLGGGNRYTWVPYSLVFFGAILLSAERRTIQVLIFATALIISYKNFHYTSSSNLQFKSFANFSDYKEVAIPIHPQWPTYPGWYIAGSPDVKKRLQPNNEKHIRLSDISASGADVKFSYDRLHVTSTTNDPILIFTNSIVCEKASDVAMEIDLIRSSEGWIQLFWGTETNNFSESNSLRRWYPTGLVKAQFAFPNNGTGIHIRFDPMELPGKAEITGVTAYCLP